MTLQVLLLLSLAATDVLIGIQSLGVFWPVLIAVAAPLYRQARIFSTPQDSQLRKSLMLVLAGMAISSLISGASKPSSLAYALMFFIYGFWLLSTQDVFRANDVRRGMKIIIAAYFCSALAATLVIAMDISGMESFFLTRVWTNINTGEARPLGFSSEPSYAAFIVVLAWMALVRLDHIRPGARNGFALWTGLTLLSLQFLGSIYGYMLAVIVALTSLYLLPKRARRPWLAGGAAVGALATMYIGAGGDDVRSLRILQAVATGDLETWLLEDTSSFFRFGPLFTYLVGANFGDLATWLGHGATSSSYFFVELFRIHIAADNDTVELGLLPAYIYDYGLITGALLLGFLYRTTQGPLRPAMVAIFTLLVFNANFSTQMMWFAVTCALISRQPTHPPLASR